MKEGREGKGKGERAAMTVRDERRVEQESVRGRARAKESEIDKGREGRHRRKQEMEEEDKGRTQSRSPYPSSLPHSQSRMSTRQPYWPSR